MANFVYEKDDIYITKAGYPVQVVKLLLNGDASVEELGISPGNQDYIVTPSGSVHLRDISFRPPSHWDIDHSSAYCPNKSRGGKLATGMSAAIGKPSGLNSPIAIQYNNPQGRATMPTPGQVITFTHPRLGDLNWGRVNHSLHVSIEEQKVINYFGPGYIARSFISVFNADVPDFKFLTMSNTKIIRPVPGVVLFTADITQWNQVRQQLASIPFQSLSFDPLDNLQLPNYGKSIAYNVPTCTCDLHALMREGCKCGASAAEKKSRA